MEEVIAALFSLFVISRARDYFEKKFDVTLLLLEDQSLAEPLTVESESVQVLYKIIFTEDVQVARRPSHNIVPWLSP